MLQFKHWLTNYSHFFKGFEICFSMKNSRKFLSFTELTHLRAIVATFDCVIQVGERDESLMYPQILGKEALSKAIYPQN